MYFRSLFNKSDVDVPRISLKFSVLFHPFDIYFRFTPRMNTTYCLGVLHELANDAHECTLVIFTEVFIWTLHGIIDILWSLITLDYNGILVTKYHLKISCRYYTHEISDIDEKYARLLLIFVMSYFIVTDLVPYLFDSLKRHTEWIAHVKRRAKIAINTHRLEKKIIPFDFESIPLTISTRLRITSGRFKRIKEAMLMKRYAKNFITTRDPVDLTAKLKRSESADF